jgi:hypothetical protein
LRTPQEAYLKANVASIQSDLILKIKNSDTETFPPFR